MLLAIWGILDREIDFDHSVGKEHLSRFNYKHLLCDSFWTIHLDSYLMRGTAERTYTRTHDMEWANRIFEINTNHSVAIEEVDTCWSAGRLNQSQHIFNVCSSNSTSNIRSGELSQSDRKHQLATDNNGTLIWKSR